VSEASVIAHPNLALSKYWGKRPGTGNFPAVPSLSVTLTGLSTRTRVRFEPAGEPKGGGPAGDDVILGGHPASGVTRQRVVDLLDRVRRAAGHTRRAEVTSENDFPTAGGLASSASGFAALALAAVRASRLDWDVARVSDLARRSSASAARSLFGGFVELPAGPPAATEADVLSAHPVADADHLPIAVLVGITTDAPKSVGSTDGMRETLLRSPYARAWLDDAPKLHLRLRDALAAGDFPTVGALAEASALAMHACAIAAGVIYWNGVTLALLGTIRSLRADGLSVFASIDAGPHVKALALPGDLARVRSAIEATAGVVRVVEARVGEGARLVAGTAAGTAP
jgi:diphosphomevalonate decarboxylase